MLAKVVFFPEMVAFLALILRRECGGGREDGEIRIQETDSARVERVLQKKGPINPFLPRIQNMVRFHETSYTLPKGGEEYT